MKKNLFKIIAIFSSLVLLPTITFAQSEYQFNLGPIIGGPASTYTEPCVGLTGVGKFICQTKEILNSIIPILIVLAVIYFIWGVIRYVISAEEEDKKKGRSQIIYGLIGLAVIIGLGGLVNLLVNTFDLGGVPISGPTVGTGVAGACASLTGIGKIICEMKEILNSIIPLLIVLAVIYFIWGVIRYVISAEEEDKKKGRSQIIYGLIGLAVIIGLGGLVNLIANTFHLGGTTTPTSVALGSCPVPDSGSMFGAYANYVTCLINSSIIPLLFALATVMFIWGTIRFFIIDANDEAKRTQGRQFMIWGIIALAVMISVWGLVSILGATFGLNRSVLPQVVPPGQELKK